MRLDREDHWIQGKGKHFRGRTTIYTLSAEKLKHENLIAYKRREMQILDVPRLERRSCECYSAVKDHLENFTEYGDGEAVGTWQSKELLPILPPRGRSRAGALRPSGSLHHLVKCMHPARVVS